VPTGWEVTLNLVRKLAELQGEAADDPRAWYKERFGREPSYSEMVNELAPTQDERRSLLQGYFEPDEETARKGGKNLLRRTRQSRGSAPRATYASS